MFFFILVTKIRPRGGGGWWRCNIYILFKKWSSINLLFCWSCLAKKTPSLSFTEKEDPIIINEIKRVCSFVRCICAFKPLWLHKFEYQVEVWIVSFSIGTPFWYNGILVKRPFNILVAKYWLFVPKPAVNVYFLLKLQPDSEKCTGRYI